MRFRVEYVNKLKITITTFLLILLSAFAYFFCDFFKPIENQLIDIRSNLSLDNGLWSQRYQPADENIIILSINDLTQYESAHSSELNLTRWPWSRNIWAKIINFVEKQKPAILVVDLNFSNYEDLSRNYVSADMALADALGYYGNTILATALKTPYREESSANNEDITNNFENPYIPTSDSLNINITNKQLDKNISYFSHTPIPNIFTNSTTMAVTNLVTNKNRNENIRYSQPIYKLLKENKEYYIPSIGLAVLLKKEGLENIAKDITLENNILKIGNHKIRINDNGQTLINWHSKDSIYPDIPINAILLSMVRGTDFFEYNNKKIPLNYFKDKIVLITQTQMGVETHNTPVAKDYTDAQIKATIIDNYLNDADTKNSKRKPFLKHITPYKGIIITSVFCLTIIFIMLIATNLPLAFANGVLTIVTYILLSIFLFCHPKFRIIIDMALPLYWMCSLFAISFILKAHHEIKKRKKIQKIFGNLVSEKVLKQLVNKPHRLNLKSTVQNVTIMSCDIRNNLQISKDFPAEKYVKVINEIFTEIEKIIFKYNGTINRFVGNSVFVYWGYPINTRKDSKNAILAGIEIKEKIEEYNQSFKNISFDDYDERNFENKNPSKCYIDARITINTGDAIIGQIGSTNVSEFTVLGKAVDILERVDSVCSELGKNLIVTENTLAQLDEELPVEFAGQIRLKNSSDKIKIFELKLP